MAVSDINASQLSMPVPISIPGDSQQLFQSQVSQNTAAKGQQFDDRTKLPNIHTGLHHAEVAEEYGGTAMVSTLQGEDKHKYFKKIIGSTNFHNAAATLLHREQDHVKPRTEDHFRETRHKYRKDSLRTNILKLHNSV
ncbi:hypothetical protein E4U41_006044 [Claviceps citrina]|nr:hypothetical protein E4U41_006044 [Claviceps citrina]